MPLSDHNPEQRQAIEHVSGPLLIVAGAGTGKTRVIVERVGHLLRTVAGLRPENILALTFSEKAAGEMQQRAAARFQAARRCRFFTFHAFCYGLLSEHSPRTPPWKAVDEYDHWIYLRRNLESLNLDYYLRVSEPGRFLHDLLEFCSRCHDNLVTPAIFSEYVENLTLDSSTPPQEPGKKAKARLKHTPEEQIARQREAARVFARSEAMQEEAGLLSFGAMLARAVALLQGSPGLPASLQRQYRFILVDEFQDTNWAQIELLRLLAGDEQNVTVVGDRKQAIYHFRGASHTSFDLFKQTFPAYRQVVLEENYRSTKRVLSVADTAISLSAADRDQPPQPLWTSNEPGSKPEVWEFVSEAEQAEFIAREIARRVTQGEAKAFSDFAVLYRAHHHRDRLVAALRRRGVPFAIRKLAINHHPRVRDLVACLRAIGHPHDSISLLRVMSDGWHIEPDSLLRYCHSSRSQQRPLRDVLEAAAASGEEAGRSNSANGSGIQRLLEFLSRYRAIAQQQRLGVWLHQLRDERRLFQRAEEAPVWKAVFDFVATWDTEKSSTGMLDEFLEYFAYYEEAGGTITLPDQEAGTPVSEFAPEEESWGIPPPPSAEPRQGRLWQEQTKAEALGKVQLMTMHAAKGLEFEHVFLLHLVRGAFPSRRQAPLIEFPAALLKGPPPAGDVHKEEERRLFYVALTRAKRSLALCTVSNEKQRPSEFLEQLRDSHCPDLEWKIIPPCGVPAHPEIPAPRIPAPPAANHDLVLSVSGVETYLGCPLKYFFSHICRVPILPSAALRFGSIMHGAIRGVVRGLERDPEAMHPAAIEAILRQHWREAGFTDPLQERRYWEMGLAQLEGVRRTFSQKPFELLAQEQPFEFLRGGVKVVGRIDQINRLTGRDIELIDYKTGRAHTQQEADRSLQLTVYAQACREALHLAPAEIVLYNLETQELLRTRRGPDDFRQMEEVLIETSTRIAAGRFAPSPGYQCKFCDYRALCPAHDDFS